MTRPAPRACPECQKPFPPMHGGRIRRRRRGRRAVETWAFWCLFCETWWVLDVSKPVARRCSGETAATVSALRRASVVEADQARRILFAGRGLGVPVD